MTDSVLGIYSSQPSDEAIQASSISSGLEPSIHAGQDSGASKQLESDVSQVLKQQSAVTEPIHIPTPSAQLSQTSDVESSRTVTAEKPATSVYEMTIPKVTVPAPTAQDSKPLQPVVTKARPSSEAKKTTTEAPAAVASAPPPPAVQQVKPVPPVEEIKPVKQELKTAADETTVSLPEKDTPAETRSSEREKEPVIEVKQVEPETEIAKEVVSLSKPKMEMQKEKPISVSEAKVRSMLCLIVRIRTQYLPD